MNARMGTTNAGQSVRQDAAGMVVAAAPIDKLVIRGGVGQVMPMNGPFYYCKCIYMFLSLLKMVPPDKYATLPSLSGCVCVSLCGLCAPTSRE